MYKFFYRDLPFAYNVRETSQPEVSSFFNHHINQASLNHTQTSGTNISQQNHLDANHDCAAFTCVLFVEVTLWYTNESSCFSDVYSQVCSVCMQDKKNGNFNFYIMYEIISWCF